MKKGILKRTPKHKIKRCSAEVQRLKESIRGGVSSSYLTEALERIEALPNLNKEPILIRNRQGVLVEIVGRHGSSTKYGVDYKKGVYYFDGNRVGKRKLRFLKAFFEEDIARSIPDHEEAALQKVWTKLTTQGRL